MIVAGLIASGPTRAEPAARIMASTGLDLWADGASVWLSALYAPAGLDRNGWVAKLTGSGSLYTFTTALSPLGEGTGQSLGLSAQVGWRGAIGPVWTTLLIGADMVDRQVVPDDPWQAGRGLRGGVRLTADLWWQPRPDWMLSGSAQVTSIATGYSARAQAGMRLLDAVWLGPELAIMGDTGSHRLRAGVHATGFRVRGTEWSVSLGASRTDDGRAGPYGMLSALMRY
jgi:Cellulose biosynthesis protein BcsS